MNNRTGLTQKERPRFRSKGGESKLTNGNQPQSLGFTAVAKNRGKEKQWGNFGRRKKGGEELIRKEAEVREGEGINKWMERERDQAREAGPYCQGGGSTGPAEGNASHGKKEAERLPKEKVLRFAGKASRQTLRRGNLVPDRHERTLQNFSKGRLDAFEKWSSQSKKTVSKEGCRRVLY